MLLVTVGSTLFQDLSDAALGADVLAAVRAAGEREVVVQLGRAAIPEHLGVGPDGGQCGREGVKVTVMRYTSSPGEMDALVRRASAVVSHAGSGTILSVLRACIPLLVVPNSALMDNHQQELADALKKEGYLDVCRPSELKAGVARLFAASEKASIKPFPAFQPQRFASILDEAAGFA